MFRGLELPCPCFGLVPHRSFTVSRRFAQTPRVRAKLCPPWADLKISAAPSRSTIILSSGPGERKRCQDWAFLRPGISSRPARLASVRRTSVHTYTKLTRLDLGPQPRERLKSSLAEADWAFQAPSWVFNRDSGFQTMQPPLHRPKRCRLGPRVEGTKERPRQARVRWADR